MTEDEKELRDIYFSKYPEGSDRECMNWILGVYAEDDKWDDRICVSGIIDTFGLRSFMEELEERIV